MTEGLYKLPSGWRWVRLGDIFELQQGASMSPRRRRGTNPKPFLRTVNIRWGIVDLSHIDEMDFTESEAQKLSLKPGDLLICEGGDVGRTALWQGEIETCLYQNHIHRLRRRDDSILPKFYAYWMQAAYQVFVAYSGQESRTAIPNLSGRRLKEFAAPLPPFDEQCSIVAKVEALMERVKEAKRLRTKTRQDAENIVDGVRYVILSSLKTIQFAKLVDSYKNGIYKPKHFYGRGFPSVRMFNIVDGKVNLDRTPLLDVTPDEMEKYGLEKDDILINRVNSRELVGKSGLVPIGLGPCTFESKNIRVRVKRELAEPAFVAEGLNSATVRRQILAKLKPAIGQATVNQDDLDQLQIPLIPNLDEQQRIVNYLNEIRQRVLSLKRAQEKTETELQRLEQSILDRAFRGEL